MEQLQELCEGKQSEGPMVLRGASSNDVALTEIGMQAFEQIAQKSITKAAITSNLQNHAIGLNATTLLLLGRKTYASFHRAYSGICS